MKKINKVTYDEVTIICDLCGKPTFGTSGSLSGCDFIESADRKVQLHYKCANDFALAEFTKKK
jgi:hypothetical protein